MYRVIAPTLRTLTIDCDELTWFARFLPLFSNLSRLSIGASHFGGIPDPAPLLRCLPPSLTLLRLAYDTRLGPGLAHWTAHPSLVPAGLKEVQIDYIEKVETYQQLPPVPTLRTNYRWTTLDSLGRLSPGTCPFKTLEMYFPARYLIQRSVAESECSRLGVVLRQRVEFWDD